MKFSPNISEARRRLVDELEEAKDYRTDKQKLDEAIERHLVNASLLKALSGDPGEIDEEAFGAAEKAYEDSQATLFHLVEDICLVNPKRLAEALAA